MYIYRVYIYIYISIRIFSGSGLAAWRRGGDVHLPTPDSSQTGKIGKIHFFIKIEIWPYEYIQFFMRNFMVTSKWTQTLLKWWFIVKIHKHIWIFIENPSRGHHRSEINSPSIAKSKIHILSTFWPNINLIGPKKTWF